MSWSSGTDLVRKIACAIHENVAHEVVRAKLYEELIEAAEQQDWDFHSEAEGIDPVLDVVLSAR